MQRIEATLVKTYLDATNILGAQGYHEHGRYWLRQNTKEGTKKQHISSKSTISM